MFWSVASSVGRAPEDDFWYGPVGTATASGQSVSPSRALALPAVYSAVKVITDAVMQIPLILYRRTANGGKERATNHPLYGLLHDQPNVNQTSPEWREIMQHHTLLRGNSYAEIINDGRGVVEIGMPEHPDFVRVERAETSQGPRYRYVISESGRATRVVSASNMLHIRGLGLGQDGITGLSPIDMEREAVGVGLAAQDFSARFFKNDARPGGWLEVPTNFKDKSQRDAFKREWRSAHGGPNRHETAVLEYGIKYHPLEVKMVDAQFLETRKYQNLDIARIFRVPPHLIMELDRATFSNITQQDIEFVKFSLLPWLTRWERRLSVSLLSVEERATYFFEFLVDGLERGDASARATYYNRGIQDGWLTRNEVRLKENLDPLDGLDEPLEPLNMTNPGGRNDGQVDGLRANAAEALARKQMHALQGMTVDDAREFLAADWHAVVRFMLVSEQSARTFCAEAAESFDTAMSPDDWRAVQALRLGELR